MTHKTIRMKKYWIALVFAASIAGCAHMGNKFDLASADTFQPGVTTLDEAKAKLGEPVAVSTDANGSQRVSWKYVSASPVGAQGARLDVVFDKDGKMVRVAHRAKVN
jgi:hypothetical protein